MKDEICLYDKIVACSKIDASTYYQWIDSYGEEMVHQAFLENIDKMRNPSGNLDQIQFLIWDKFGYFLALLDHNPFEEIVIENLQGNSKNPRRKLSSSSYSGVLRQNGLLSIEEEVYYAFHLLKREYIEVFLNEEDFVTLNISKIFASISSMELFGKVLDRFDSFYQVCGRNSYFDQKFKCFLRECRKDYQEGKLSNFSEYGNFLCKNVDVLEERALLDQIDMYIKFSIARENFVLCNIRLVEKFVDSFYKMECSVDKEDFVQEGFLGLTNAIDHFDIRRVVKFSTYAYQGIKNSVFRSYCNFSKTIRLSVHCHNLLFRIDRIKRVFYQKMGRGPKICELAGILNMDVDHLNSVLAMVGQVDCLSLQKVSYVNDNDGEEVLLESCIADSSMSLEEEVLSKRMKQELSEFMKSKLTDRERDVLLMRSGCYSDDESSMTLQEIASIMNCTRENIRLIEKKARKKLTRTEMGRSFLGY